MPEGCSSSLAGGVRWMLINTGGNWLGEMDESFPAFHKAIVGVDIEGFADRRRTNPDQVVMRAGLYRCLRIAFARSGIAWEVCYHEDRGDGALILVPPEVPKNLLVTRFPQDLSVALRSHNQAHAAESRIRVRLVMHAGEILRDEYGVAGTAINVAFRLLEARPLKQALAGSPGSVALIVSRWFFEEVIRHTPASQPAAYRQVRVLVKETDELAWICLPDSPHSLDGGENITGGQRRDLRPRTAAEGEAGSSGGLPVEVPLGRLPAEVRGRDALLAEMLRPLTRKLRRPGMAWVLAGMGGLGKSTVALSVARTARAKGWRVWWVTATDTTSLTGGMLEVLRQLGAPEAVTQPVREGAPTAAERAWEFLNGPHRAGRKWLLIFDNADTPAVLAAHGASPADHTGWLRPDPSGMVIVTTRTRDRRVWGPGVALRELPPLDDADAAKVLTDLAPGIADPDAEEARELGRRLGGLPLALHLAGSYLASPFARWYTFAGYHNALDSAGLPEALADLDSVNGQARATIQRTWDLSLDALADDGVQQARPLLFLLSCYAPATPIPAVLLQYGNPLGLLARDGKASAVAGEEGDGEREQRLRYGLRGLATVGLIDIADSKDPAGPRDITVHPVVADANRSRLLTTARPGLPAIGESAVQALRAVTGQLDHLHPGDWPSWRRLVPHVTAILGWLAPHLAADTLADVLHVCNQTADAADALVRGGNSADAEKLARSSVKAAITLGSDHPAHLIACHVLAAAVWGRGRYGEAERLYREVLTSQQRVLGQDHPDTLSTRSNLARTIAEQGRYQEAEKLARQVLTSRQRVLGDDHPDTLSTRYNIARAIGQQGRSSEAEQLFLRVLADQRRILGDEHPDTVVTRHRLARVIVDQGRYAEAEQLLQAVLADRSRVLGGDHPGTLATRSNLARTIGAQARYEEAEQLYRAILADRSRVLGDDHPETVTIRHRLALVIGHQGRYTEAEQLCRHVLADRQRLLGDDHPDTLNTRHRLAHILANSSQYREAEELCRSVLADRQRVLGDEHPDTLSTRHELGRVIGLQSRYGEAEQLYDQVLTSRLRVLGNDHPDTLTTHRELAQITSLHHPVTERQVGPPQYLR